MDLQRIIWLASYPKSGNTWLRLLLANYCMPEDEEVDLNTINRFTTADTRQDFFDRAAGRPFHARDVPDWLGMRQKALRLIAASKPGNHFVKTHCLIARIGGETVIPPEMTAGAVYVYRNPFDVAISYARHLNIGVDETVAMMAEASSMTASRNNLFTTLGRWDTHIESWTSAQGMWRHVMRYEDMADDIEASLRGLLAFLKVPVESARMKRALDETRFEALQQQEKDRGFRERPAEMEQFFVSGRPGGWRETLTADQIARIREAFAPAIEKRYPELYAETAGSAVRQ